MSCRAGISTRKALWQSPESIKVHNIRRGLRDRQFKNKTGQQHVTACRIRATPRPCRLEGASDRCADPHALSNAQLLMLLTPVLYVRCILAITPQGSTAFRPLSLGSSSGIGKAVALAFATQNKGSHKAPTKICVMSRSKTRLQSVVEEIEKLGAQGYAVAGDLTKGSDCQTIVEEAVRTDADALCRFPTHCLLV